MVQGGLLAPQGLVVVIVVSAHKKPETGTGRFFCLERRYCIMYVDYVPVISAEIFLSSKNTEKPS